jgi:predicted sugar kinase
MTHIYGELSSEKLAIENENCRKIVKEIMDFGVNQRQLGKVIYLLSLNLENIEVVQELSAAIKELMPEIFVSKNDNSGNEAING